jgi:hypothetical protein
MKRRATHKKVSASKRVVWRKGVGGGRRCDKDTEGVTVSTRGKGQKLHTASSNNHDNYNSVAARRICVLGLQCGVEGRQRGYDIGGGAVVVGGVSRGVVHI